jgi:hypothetical protein
MTLKEAGADPADVETVIQLIRRQAHPLSTLDPQATLTDPEPLRPRVRTAKVPVGRSGIDPVAGTGEGAGFRFLTCWLLPTALPPLHQEAV